MTRLRGNVTKTLNIHEAKTHLSRLLAEVAGGAEIVIAKNGKPIARLIALTDRKPRMPGRFRGQIAASHGGFLEPLSPREIALWENGHKKDPLRVP